MTEPIADNVKRIQDRIAAACAAANRDPASVKLVAVSKRKPVEDVLAAAAAGVQHFGENRVEEAQEKIPAVAARLGGDAPPLAWHMVGHVQSRKTKEVLGLFSVCHSVDSVKLAKRMARQSADGGHAPEVFIQVNVSGEAQKYGLAGHGWETDPAVREPLMETIGEILTQKPLTVRGLMTMAPYGAPEGELHRDFASLAALKVAVERAFDVQLPDLSMGMTDDFPIAIQEGATVIRVGRALFGERDR